MKIKYVHFSEPENEKIFNTVKAYKNRVTFGSEAIRKQTQEDYDQQTLKKMEKDKQSGIVLSYEIVENSAE